MEAVVFFLAGKGGFGVPTITSPPKSGVEKNQFKKATSTQ